MYEDLRNVHLELGALHSQLASCRSGEETASPVPVRNRLPVLLSPPVGQACVESSLVSVRPAQEGPAILPVSPPVQTGLVSPSAADERIYDQPDDDENPDLVEGRVTVGRNQFDLLLARFDKGCQASAC